MAALKKTSKKLPQKTRDLPANHGMLLEFRNEVMVKLGSHDQRFESMDKRFDSIDQRFDSIDKRFASIDQRFESIDKRFDSIDQRFDSIDKRFASIDQRFESIDKRFDSMDKRLDSIDKRFEAVDARFDSLEKRMDSGFSEVKSFFHQAMLRFEEQRAENRIVLEGYHLLHQRQDRLETDVREIRDIVKSLAQSRDV